MSDRYIHTGDHRYLHGVPITIVGHPTQTEWHYVDGHVQIKNIALVNMLPSTPGVHVT